MEAKYPENRRKLFAIIIALFIHFLFWLFLFLVSVFGKKVTENNYLRDCVVEGVENLSAKNSPAAISFAQNLHNTYIEQEIGQEAEIFKEPEVNMSTVIDTGDYYHAQVSSVVTAQPDNQVIDSPDISLFSMPFAPTQDTVEDIIADDGVDDGIVEDSKTEDFVRVDIPKINENLVSDLPISPNGVIKINTSVMGIDNAESIISSFDKKLKDIDFKASKVEVDSSKESKKRRRLTKRDFVAAVNAAHYSSSRPTAERPNGRDLAVARQMQQFQTACYDTKFNQVMKTAFEIHKAPIYFDKNISDKLTIIVSLNENGTVKDVEMQCNFKNKQFDDFVKKVIKSSRFAPIPKRFKTKEYKIAREVGIEANIGINVFQFSCVGDLRSNF